jgi:mono/diheme cytochrome c family protein
MSKRAKQMGFLVARISAVISMGLLALGCGASADAGETASNAIDSTSQAITAEDGLADAYATFKEVFVRSGFDQRLNMGVGYNPALSTEKLVGVAFGRTANAKVVFNFPDKKLSATLRNVPAGAAFDLWFVKNVPGAGRTFKPEAGDQLLKVASFVAGNQSTPCFGDAACQVVPEFTLGSNINFDLDLVVITRAGKDPTVSRVAVGDRTLFEKRFFRERQGKALDPVSGTVAAVETTDQLVGRGAQLFFNESFAGNGRTCGTCHRAENNLTIDPAFIATLPQSDALFVPENVPALAQLENRTLLRSRALILENVAGFDDPTHVFVERSVNHTFSLALTEDIATGGLATFPVAPPDHRLGWGGDGAPGRGTLHEFALGAIVQHFPKSLARRPGVDFRIPTQEELDALEAFQLFTGRQKTLVATNLQFRDPHAARGRDLFNGQGACSACHFDLGQPVQGNFDTGVAALTPDLPQDSGFLNGVFGEGFNVPPLVEAADTAPLFHNNSANTIEDAVHFYTTDNFRFSSAGRGFFVNLTSPDQEADVASFLRVLNAAENVRQIRKRSQFVRDHRSDGNSDLLRIAIADAQDAIEDLATKRLNPAAVSELQDIKTTLNIALANADADRPAFMDHALIYLSLVRNELFSANPDNQF